MKFCSMDPWQKQGRAMALILPCSLVCAGEDPVTFDVNAIDTRIRDIKSMGKLALNGEREIDFNPNEDIEFLFTETLPYHPNALTFLAVLSNEEHIAETYYSVGGGFVHKEGEQPGDDNDVNTSISNK